jgi:DNA-binding GntR family transcriptional regulator
VRDALARLESAGVVIRRHGIGTFLSEPLRARPGMIWGWLDEAPAFEDLISQSGYEARCHLLSTGTIPAAEVANHLNISPDEIAVTIEKRFTADETPIIYSWTALAKGLVDEHNEFSSIPREAFQQSIYEFLQQYCQHNVSYQTSEVHAIEADETMAEQLTGDIGAPLLQVAEIGYSEEGVPLFYATHCFRGDRVSFRLIRIPTFTVESI